VARSIAFLVTGATIVGLAGRFSRKASREPSALCMSRSAIGGDRLPGAEGRG
jgi:hypothetical protein